MKYIGCALRGRYRPDGTTEQHLEINSYEHINCLSTVEKDSYLLVLKEKNDADSDNKRLL